MRTKGTCSECEQRFELRGFIPHNNHTHDGAAELIEDEQENGDEETDGESPSTDASEIAEESDTDTAFETDENEVEGDPDAGDISGQLEEETDEPEYNCSDCGEGLEYLGGEDNPEGPGKVCPGCGNRLLWSKM